ncbi:hypothetical protein P8605_02805 [Streptomyces sp. T-3]|nr:hypothetical protein [Streptomyces sp. T-3]
MKLFGGGGPAPEPAEANSEGEAAMAEQGARQVLPEVQTYFESVETLAADRSAAVAAAAAKYPERYGYGEKARRQDRAHSEEVSKAYAAHTKAHAVAWGTLTASSDPLVKWIAENCADHCEEARCVLGILPATVDEIDDLAEREGWCRVWEDYRQRALDAGVLPGTTPPTQAMNAVFEQIDEENCCRMSSNSRRRIRRALDALIQESLAAAASAAEAKAVEVPA